MEPVKLEIAITTADKELQYISALMEIHSHFMNFLDDAETKRAHDWFTAYLEDQPREANMRD